MTPSSRDADALLDAIISSAPPPYALIQRNLADGGAGLIDVLVGDSEIADTLADLATEISPNPVLPEHGVLAIVPFRQIRERGYDYIDDGEALRLITIKDCARFPLDELLRRLPDSKIELRNERYDLDDEAYAGIARKIIHDEIGGGAGANFVLKRSYLATIDGFDNLTALSVFRSLMMLETGAYWTFIAHTGDRTFVGASPERHVSLCHGVAVMNPISGTYRYPPSGPTLEGVRSFLADSKEADELYMVVDEELKMMARICDTGGTIDGPTIKPMSRLAHTEYHITGACCLRPAEILKETLFAPTVTGSPLENACRVIKKHEPHGRGYYSGIIALIGRNSVGGHALDSAILIRTADISCEGHIRIGVGSTLVRDSNPASEAAETKTKASGLLQAMTGSGTDQAAPAAAAASRIVGQFAEFARDGVICSLLAARNSEISAFWLKDGRQRVRPQFDLAGLNAVIVDAEDAFTSMIRHQLQSLGLGVVVRRFDEPLDPDQFDLVVMGPGPGDPCDVGDPRIASLDNTIGTLLAEQRPFLAVCLSHQVLSRRLGLDLLRRAQPNQGMRRRIDLFGQRELLGFYNSFNALCAADELTTPNGNKVDVSRDAETNEVFALRSSFFVSFQFHAESVLSQDGDRIFGAHLRNIVRERAPRATHWSGHFRAFGKERQDAYDEHHR